MSILHLNQLYFSATNPTNNDLELPVSTERRLFLDTLCCPKCQSQLDIDPSQLSCSDCPCKFKIDNAIPHFATLATPHNEANTEVAFRKKYEHQYQHTNAASDYRDSFVISRRKSQRTSIEIQILDSLLSRFTNTELILDLPCGGGRLSSEILKHCKHLIEADISLAQLALAMQIRPQAQIGMIASALSLPFKDDSIDGTICARLTHHIPDIDERALLVDEYLRVAKSFSIISFTDKKSVHSISRKLRGKQINPCAMSVQELEQIAAKRNAKLRQVLTVSNLGPRHRFALFTL